MHAETDERPYLLERVDNVAVVQLYADGFDQLALREKVLIWHLSPPMGGRFKARRSRQAPACTPANPAPPR